MKKTIASTLIFLCLAAALPAEEALPPVAANQDHMGYREVAVGAQLICLARIRDLAVKKTAGRMLPSGEGSQVWLKVEIQRVLRGAAQNSELAVLARDQKWYASGRFLKDTPVILFLRPLDSGTTARPAGWSPELPVWEINGPWGKLLLRGFDDAEIERELRAVTDALQAL